MRWLMGAALGNALVHYLQRNGRAVAILCFVLAFAVVMVTLVIKWGVSAGMRDAQRKNLK